MAIVSFRSPCADGFRIFAGETSIQSGLEPAHYRSCKPCRPEHRFAARLLHVLLEEGLADARQYDELSYPPVIRPGYRRHLKIHQAVVPDIRDQVGVAKSVRGRFVRSNSDAWRCGSRCGIQEILNCLANSRTVVGHLLQGTRRDRSAETRNVPRWRGLARGHTIWFSTESYS